MGPDDSAPVRLCYIDPETGERHELPDALPELSFTEAEGRWEPMYFGGCGDCSYADHKRKQGEKIRCKRWSRWVNPQGKPCEEHSISFPLNLTPEQYLGSLEMMKHYQRKHGGHLA